MTTIVIAWDKVQFVISIIAMFSWISVGYQLGGKTLDLFLFIVTSVGAAAIFLLLLAFNPFGNIVVGGFFVLLCMIFGLFFSKIKPNSEAPSL